MGVENVRTNERRSGRQKRNERGTHTDCAAVAVKEKLYIMGGWNQSIAGLSSCEMLDLSVNKNDTSESVSIPSMQDKRGFPCCGCVQYYKTKIVVLGGWKGSENLPTVEMFDTVENVWTKLPPMPTARSGLCCGCCGFFYPCGWWIHEQAG